MSERAFTPASGFIRAAVAARELGVDPALIDGLVSAGKIDGVRQPNAKGNWVTMVSRDAVADIKAQLARS